MLTLHRKPASWELILADLSLILFLATAAGLTAASQQLDNQSRAQASADKPPSKAPAQLAATQSLYRPGPGLPSLQQWLSRQPRDPRAALTIVAQHQPGKDLRAWDEARAMADIAKQLGVRSRVIIREGANYDLYASLAYDQPKETPAI